MRGPPIDIPPCIEIIFQPFKDLHLTNLSRIEHTTTSIHLLSLLADLSSTGMIDKVAFQTSFCEALYQLRVPNLQEFVAVSPSLLSYREERESKISL